MRLTLPAFVGRIAFSALAALIGAAFALPLVWFLFAPFNARAELGLAVPDPWTLSNFATVVGNSFAVAVTLTSPAPDWPSTSVCASSSWARFMLSCICCACFISPASWFFIMVGSLSRNRYSGLIESARTLPSKRSTRSRTNGSSRNAASVRSRASSRSRRSRAASDAGVASPMA